MAKLRNHKWTHRFDNQYAHYIKMEASIMDVYINIDFTIIYTNVSHSDYLAALQSTVKHLIIDWL